MIGDIKQKSLPINMGSHGPINGRRNGQTYDELTKKESLFCCLLCMETFENPRILKCNHVFCERCLYSYCKTFQIQYNEDETLTISCPTCQKPTRLTSGGIESLTLDQNNHMQYNRKVSVIGDGALQKCDTCVFKFKMEEPEYYCSRCTMNFCPDCKNLHDLEVVFKSHTVVHISNKEVINLYCEKHNKLPCIYFCLTCNTPACTVCLMHNHSMHNNTKLRDALALKRENIKTVLNSLLPVTDKMDSKLKKIYFMSARRRNGVVSSTSDLPQRFSYFERTSLSESKDSRSSVSDTKSEKSNELSISNSLLTNNNNTKDTIENRDAMLAYNIEKYKKLCDLASKILEMSQSKKLLIVYEDIVARLRTVLEFELQHILSDLDDRLEKEMMMLNGFGHHHPITPSQSSGSLQDRIPSYSSTHSDESGSLDDSAFDIPQLSLLFKPKLIWKMEKQRSDPGELWNPCDITFLGSNNVVVCEYDIQNDKNNRLRIFDMEGKSKGVIAQGEIKPLGVTVTKEGHIAVTDCKHKRVKVYDVQTGACVGDLGKGQFGWPYGLAVNSKGQYIVSDAFNDTVSIYQPDGKRYKTFGSSGSNSSQFKNPYHVTVDSHDNILVSDSGNSCVKVFDAAGSFMFVNGDLRRRLSSDMERKVKKRRLRGPRGISVDLRGNILVADDCSRVCLFDSTGKYTRNLLTDEDQVKYPESLATNTDGLLAVTEWNPNNMFAVKVFHMYE